jgi:AraC family transcriptional regulator
MTAYGRLRDDNAGRPATRRLAVELLGQALALLDDDLAAARCRVEDAFALLSDSPEIKPTKHRMLAQWKIRRAEEYISAHLGSSLRLQDVARSVDMSAGYFSRAFKKAIGVSYSEYVTKNRLDLAKRLLLTSDSPIAEVARGVTRGSVKTNRRGDKTTVSVRPSQPRFSAALLNATSFVETKDGSAARPTPNATTNPTIRRFVGAVSGCNKEMAAT